MYEGCLIELQMFKMILEGEPVDEQSYYCELMIYDEENECMHLLLKDGEVDAISLDGVYECRLEEENLVICHGMVKERFIDKRGNVLIFQIENGFYKNNLN